MLGDANLPFHCTFSQCSSTFVTKIRCRQLAQKMSDLGQLQTIIKHLFLNSDSRSGKSQTCLQQLCFTGPANFYVLSLPLRDRNLLFPSLYNYPSHVLQLLMQNLMTSRREGVFCCRPRAWNRLPTVMKFSSIYSKGFCSRLLTAASSGIALLNWTV